LLVLGLALAGLAPATSSWAYTANKVWFEFRPNGLFRVHVNYTVPELKEYREAYIDFRRKQAAESFYWDLVRGADFYPSNPKARRFVAPVMKPSPW